MLLVFRISKKTKTNAREPEKCWSKETATENVKSRKNLLLEKEAREKKWVFFLQFFLCEKLHFWNDDFVCARFVWSRVFCDSESLKYV